MKIILSLLLFFNLCGIGNAQSQSTVEKFTATINEQYDATNKILENVNQMMAGKISDKEYRAADLDYQQTLTFQGHVSALTTLSYIYGGMREDNDKKLAKKFFNLQCKSTEHWGEVSIERINKTLPSIQSIALVNEITKMRDAIIRTMQTLEICKN